MTTRLDGKTLLGGDFEQWVALEIGTRGWTSPKCPEKVPGRTDPSFPPIILARGRTTSSVYRRVCEYMLAFTIFSRGLIKLV
jgi:hypothetical protein